MKTVEQIAAEVFQRRGIKIDSSDPAIAIVEIAHVVLEEAIEVLGTKVPVTQESLNEFKAALSDGMSKGFQRIVYTLENPQKQSGTGSSEQADLFKEVHQNFNDDMTRIGQEMAKFQSGMGDLLRELVVLKTQSTQFFQPQSGVQLKQTATSSNAPVKLIRKSHHLGYGLLAGLVCGFVLAFAFYQVLGYSQLVEYGRAFEKAWPQLDDGTKNKFKQATK